MASQDVGPFTESQLNSDPLFRSFPKLFIRDILTMPPCPVDENRFDDGTGVVPCLCWKQNSHGSQLDNLPDLPPELKGKLEELMEIRRTVSEGFGLGDLLHVRGKIKVFNGVRELMCSYHAVVDDPNVETLRMIELVRMYKDYYDVAPARPQPNDTSSSEIQIDSLKAHIELYLEEKRPKQLSSEDICKIITKTSKCPYRLTVSGQVFDGSKALEKYRVTIPLIDELFRLLEQDGTLYKSPSGRSYLVTVNNIELQKAAHAVLKSKCNKTYYLERGCQLREILEDLRKLVPYVHVKRPALMQVFDKLEENSEVFSLEPGHYQVVDS